MSFNNHMAGHRRGRPNWMDADFYPMQDAVKDIRLDSVTPVLVDIGGGKGHNVMEFKKKFPSLPGRLVVQDLPNTIQRVTSTHQGIEFLPHDFFTPQPIKGFPCEKSLASLTDRLTGFRSTLLLSSLHPA